MSREIKQQIILKNQQSVVMTHNLQQSIKLLQLSALELAEYIEQELDKNPLLSKDDGNETLANEQTESNNIDEDYDSTLDNNSQDYEHGEAYNHLTETDSPYYNHTIKRTSKNFEDYSSGNDSLSYEKSLKEHLLEQIYVDIADVSKRTIALHLTDMLNENGYLEGDIKELALTLKCSVKQIEETINLLHRLEPIGVFARSLSECLALQLKDRNLYNPAMEKMVNNLHLLAEGNINSLKKICGVTEAEIKKMVGQIKSLNPKPGSDFAKENVNYMQPDIYLRIKGNDSYILELNNDFLPKLLINRRYYSEVRRSARNKDDKKYLSDQLNNASWLIKALDQRAQTILKVATEIVSAQKEFFERGINFLKPLTLKTIADQLNMHESTISRVTTNKYLATPLGLFELKYFFSSSLNRCEGNDNLSSTTIKHFIKEIIATETESVIYSDDVIANLLKEKNIIIARRTIAKYREALNIASSSQRKTQKKLSNIYK